MTYIKIYVNYIILHLIQSYQHSQLLPSVMLPQVIFLLCLIALWQFLVPAFYSSPYSVLLFNMKTTSGDKSIITIKCKGKVHPKTGHEGPEGRKR